MSRWQDPNAPRYWVPARAQPADNPSAPRRLWRVETDTSVKDPRETEDTAWTDCQVIAFTRRFMGMCTALIEASAPAAARLRSVRGVRAVEPSPDRRYFDDRSELHVTVSGGRLHHSEE
jgi:hypothetical protein